MTEYSPAKTGEYPGLVYTKTVDNVKRANIQISCAIYLRTTRKKWRRGLHRRQVKKSSKLIFCGVFYLTVLVYTETTIHLSVGGYLPHRFAAR